MPAEKPCKQEHKRNRDQPLLWIRCLREQARTGIGMYHQMLWQELVSLGSSVGILAKSADLQVENSCNVGLDSIAQLKDTRG